MSQICQIKLSAQPGKHCRCSLPLPFCPFADFLYKHGICMFMQMVPFYRAVNSALRVKLFALLVFCTNNLFSKAIHSLYFRSIKNQCSSI